MLRSLLYDPSLPFPVDGFLLLYICLQRCRQPVHNITPIATQCITMCTNTVYPPVYNVYKCWHSGQMCSVQHNGDKGVEEHYKGHKGATACIVGKNKCKRDTR